MTTNALQAANGQDATHEADPSRASAHAPRAAEMAREFYDRDAPPEYLEDWARRLSEAEEVVDHERQSFLIFRLGREYLAVQTRSLAEVTHPQPVHVLPHRATEVLLGLINIRGQLRIAVSAHGLLGVEHGSEAADGPRTGSRSAEALQRMVIMQDRQHQWVFPVEEVMAVQQVALRDLRNVPSTFGRASSLTRAVFGWQDHTVGVLDEDRLLAALRSACS